MTSEPVVETRQGKWRGATVDGAATFKGVRYAVADRFLPPRAPDRWAGVQDALAYGAIAPQTNPNPPPGPPYVITAQFPRPAGAPPPTPAVESEDCLFLNVWTPTLDRGRKLPVMVWLHGGFFYAGSGATGDGSGIARRGEAVVVSLNHRLNAFGYCHLAGYGAEYSHSGNLGMLDIVAALEWVRDNIEGFGGDPGRVMVFGASGGGMKTSFLMASPRAKGLLHRAGVQSGPGLRFLEHDAAAHATELLFAELSLKSGDVGALKALPVKQLLAGYYGVVARLPPKRFIDLPSFAPVIDPELLPRHPFSPDAAPLARPIPMMIGWNAQEMSFFMGNDDAGFALDEAGARERFQGFLGDKAEAAYALYARRYPDASPSRRYIQAWSDYSLMLPVLALADRKAAAGGGATYAYRLDRESPALGGKLGALHSSEAPYVFDTVANAAAMTGGTPEAHALARAMSGAWTRFAATGDPNGGGLPHWPAYAVATRPIMLFGDASAAANDPQAEERRLLEPLLGA
ncbi:MAG: carboxylesterase family protein [Sphingomonas sp.]